MEETSGWYLTFAGHWLSSHGLDLSHKSEDQDAAARFIELFQKCQSPFSRQSLPGHATASAIVLNESLDKVLLTHHRKLNKWLQLGGHADDDQDLARVALREAEEESGLCSFRFVASPLWNTTIDGLPMPFDLDVHEIPARKSEPRHYHHDARFLLVACDDNQDSVVVSDESHDVRWFPLDEARKLNSERSMERQFEKVDLLKKSKSLELISYSTR